MSVCLLGQFLTVHMPVKHRRMNEIDVCMSVEQFLTVNLSATGRRMSEHAGTVSNSASACGRQALE